jgi:hypothetical protein
MGDCEAVTLLAFPRSSSTLFNSVVFGNAFGVDPAEMLVLYYWSLWDEICVLLYPLEILNSIHEGSMSPICDYAHYTFTVIFSFLHASMSNYVWPF